ncbi:MAG: nucleotide sugar dehydrogenase [Sphingomonadales bacterium]
MRKRPEKIAVVGLGYVGLPLAVALAEKFSVVGFDIDKTRIKDLQGGHDWTNEISDDEMAKSTLRVSDEPDIMEGVDVFIITTPTPIDKNNQPDLSPVVSASRSAAPYLSKGAVVVLESTVYPGVTEEVCGPALEEGSGLKAGKDFFLGYSPERINPGDREHTISSIPKVIAGQTPEVTELLANMYGAVTAGVFKAASIKTAEAAKVIENAQRDINIAFINEAALIFNQSGISIYDVLEAAGTKWNFLNFKPGLVGGHCIGVDPHYLAYFAERGRVDPEMILAGRKINESMVAYIGGKVSRKLKMGDRVLALGLTFKENVPDLRNSKAVDIIKGLQGASFKVDVHDAEADPEEVKREYGLDLVSALEPVGEKYDCVLGIVAHTSYATMTVDDFRGILKPGGLIADVKGQWRDLHLEGEFERWTL